jgi:hypothetical protein
MISSRSLIIFAVYAGRKLCDTGLILNSCYMQLYVNDVSFESSH